MLLGLYAVEAALIVLLVGLYKAPLEDWSRVSAGVAALLLAGGVGFVASGWYVARSLGPAGATRRRACVLAVATNVTSWLVAAGSAEVLVRIVARQTPHGIAVGGVTLRPTWPEVVARSREVMDREETYFVYDPELGWTVGPSRQSRDGIYRSSAEGLRSATVGERLADANPRLRVALVGDSNAFSLEVPFEDSWGHHLQQELGPGAQVLNFGVDGFGIDQMYLRYRRDARPWKSDVVVVAFIEHDLWRTLAVYPVVSFGWPGYLVKPRFELETGTPRLRNAPLPTPDQILGAPEVSLLPYIALDPGFRSTDWTWRFQGGPLFLRFLTSVSPRWPAVDTGQVAQELRELNARLLSMLAREIEADHAVPLILFLPHWGADKSLVRATIERSGLPVMDMTDCLLDVPADHRRVPSGFHYTGLANQALAQCTASAIERAQADRDAGARGAPGVPSVDGRP